MMAQIIALGSIILLIIVFLLGYEAGHYDGMRCGCRPGEPFWHKWFNIHPRGHNKTNHANE